MATNLHEGVEYQRVLCSKIPLESTWVDYFELDFTRSGFVEPDVEAPERTVSWHVPQTLPG